MHLPPECEDSLGHMSAVVTCPFLCQWSPYEYHTPTCTWGARHPRLLLHQSPPHPFNPPCTVTQVRPARADRNMILRLREDEGGLVDQRGALQPRAHPAAALTGGQDGLSQEPSRLTRLYLSAEHERQHNCHLKDGPLRVARGGGGYSATTTRTLVGESALRPSLLPPPYVGTTPSSSSWPWSG